MSKPFNPSGVLYVMVLCTLFIGVSWYYKGEDDYCRYNVQSLPLEDIAPECRDAVAAERATK